jgi:hypothetical protein
MMPAGVITGTWSKVKESTLGFHIKVRRFPLEYLLLERTSRKCLKAVTGRKDASAFRGIMEG